MKQDTAFGIVRRKSSLKSMFPMFQKACLPEETRIHFFDWRHIAYSVLAVCGVLSIE